RPGRLPVDFLSGLWIARDGDDFRVFEDGGVKAGGVFGLVVEPQARADLRGHDSSAVLVSEWVVHLVDEWEVRVRTSGETFSQSWPRPNNAVTSRKVGVNFRRQCPF